MRRERTPLQNQERDTCPICEEPLGQFRWGLCGPNEDEYSVCGPCKRQYDMLMILSAETKADRQRRRKVKAWLEGTAGGGDDVR